MNEHTKGELEVVYNGFETKNVITDGCYMIACTGDSGDWHFHDELTEIAEANAEELVRRWNSHPELAQELADCKEGCEGLKLAIQDLRPYADCYKRVCESLGIEKDILGYIEKLKIMIKSNIVYFQYFKRLWKDADDSAAAKEMLSVIDKIIKRNKDVVGYKTKIKGENERT